MSFETCKQEAYFCKYAQNSKFKLGFDVEGDPTILKGLQQTPSDFAVLYVNISDEGTGQHGKGCSRTKYYGWVAERT